MLGGVGIALALGLLISLSYRGLSIILLAPAMALIAVLASGAPLVASYTQIFMPALGSFIIQYFPLFLLGALFGKLMDDTGAAKALAQYVVGRLGPQNAIAAIVIGCAVLTYGGVSLFVVAFAVYPIAVALFEQAHLPQRLIPATIALGAFTFTMTALPGTPSIQNAIPIPYFGTTAFAAPGLGLFAGATMLALGLLWLTFRTRRMERTRAAPQPVPEKARKALREHAQSEGYDVVEISPASESALQPLSPVWLGVLPILIVIGLNYVLAAHILPAIDARYLALPQFGATTLESVQGIWAILIALVAGITALALFGWRHLTSVTSSLQDGANAATGPAFNTASLVGFGAVIASLPYFAVIRDSVLSIAPEYPLISLSIAVNILAGITGSASGGMSIALQTLGSTFLERGLAAGISPELLHRVTAIATGGLDALPHNGAVITLLAVCKMTHRDAYADIFVVACLCPILALGLVLVLATTFGSF